MPKEDVVHIYTMKFYSALKHNGTMPLAAAWVELEISVLSDLRQKDKYHMISLLCEI